MSDIIKHENIQVVLSRDDTSLLFVYVDDLKAVVRLLIFLVIYRPDSSGDRFAITNSIAHVANVFILKAPRAEFTNLQLALMLQRASIQVYLSRYLYTLMTPSRDNRVLNTVIDERAALERWLHVFEHFLRSLENVKINYRGMYYLSKE